MKRIRKSILTISLTLCMCGLLSWEHAAPNPSSSNCQKIYANSDKAYTYQLKNKQLHSFQTINGVLKDVDLKIKPSKDGKYYLSYKLYCYNSQNPFTYQITDGALHLNSTGLKWVPDKIKKGNLTITNNRAYVTLLVPSKTLDKLTLNAEDGNLYISDISCINTSLSARYGDIQLSGFNNSNELQLSAKDGNIFLSRADAGKALQITTRYGDVAAKNLTFPETARITTDDGDINLSDSRISDEIQLKTIYGDITANSLTVTGAAKMNTKDGDIHLSDSRIPGAIQCKTSNGDVSAKELSVSGAARINTADGDINLSDASISGLMTINSRNGDVNLHLAKECQNNLNIAMKTLNGEMSVKKYLGGNKKRYHEYGWNYTKSSAENSARLNVSTKDGDLYLQ